MWKTDLQLSEAFGCSCCCYQLVIKFLGDNYFFIWVMDHYISLNKGNEKMYVVFSLVDFVLYQVRQICKNRRRQEEGEFFFTALYKPISTKSGTQERISNSRWSVALLPLSAWLQQRVQLQLFRRACKLRVALGSTDALAVMLAELYLLHELFQQHLSALLVPTCKSFYI